MCISMHWLLPLLYDKIILYIDMLTLDPLQELLCMYNMTAVSNTLIEQS